MFKAFKQHIEENFPGLIQKHFLLACSGGIDSVVLAHLCAACNLSFSLAHCNFKLRGSASDEDEVFVASLAKKLKVKYYVTHFDTIGYVNKNKVSVQIAARELRYCWFSEIMTENGIELLVTAHHADDNVETFLINLSRGTGIEGLNGIPAHTDTIRRPLLQFTRDQILTYANKHDIKWKEDASNEDAKYLRNKIRNELVPVLKELHPAFDKNVAKTIEFLSGSTAILDDTAGRLKKELFDSQEDHIRIAVSALLKLSPLKSYMHLLFKAYGFTDWDKIAGLLTAQSGKEIRSATHRLIKDREVLLLQEIKEIEADTGDYFLEDTTVELPVQISLSAVDEVAATTQEILFIDKETLKHRLSVRKWRKGDYFYPKGMKGKKKLSKFFKDEKLDAIAKEAQWLLCSGDAIVWVIGRRADDRFKVTDSTRAILKITLGT